MPSIQITNDAHWHELRTSHVGSSDDRFWATKFSACRFCNKVFMAVLSEIKRGNGLYCSRTCGAKYARDINAAEIENKWRDEYQDCRGALPIMPTHSVHATRKIPSLGKCENCLRQFLHYPSKAMAHRRFCTKSCASKARMSAQEGDEHERFNKRVVVGKHGECWKWVGSEAAFGYGILWFRGKRQFAHRVSYMLHRGDIPDGAIIRHTCDNRRCTNPQHLIIGTHQSNAMDAVDRKRCAIRWGESHAGSVLNWEKVTAIRGASPLLTNAELAILLGASKETIRRARTGLSWSRKDGKQGVR